MFFMFVDVHVFPSQTKKNPAFDQFNLNNSFTLWTVLVCGYSFGGGNVI